MSSRNLVTVSSARYTKRSAPQWRALVRAFERSALTRKAFCARHELSLSTFDWWRKRLGAQAPISTGPRERALFVELSRAEPAVVARTVAAPSTWDIELDLGTGVVLRLRRSAPTC